MEADIENAEEFLAKLKERKSRELQKWRDQFEELKESSLSSIKRSSPTSAKSPSSTVGKRHRRSRRRSSWDLESCLLRDLGLEDSEIKESAYSKLGVISRTQSSLKELDFSNKSRGLGYLREVEEDEEGEIRQADVEQRPVVDKEQRFSIPVIMESLASIRVSNL